MTESVAGGEYVAADPITVAGPRAEEPAMVALESGRFLLSWRAGSAVHARIFDANGVASGASFVLSTASAHYPSLAALPGGGFVATWEGSVGNSAVAAVVRIFDASGNALTAPFAANQTSAYSQQPTVATLADGGFVVAWTGSDASNQGILMRRFDATGNPVGDEAQVNTIFGGNQTYPLAVALPGGGYVIGWVDSWYGMPNDPSQPSYRAQFYDAAGNRVGGEIEVAPFSEGRFDVVALASGQLLFVTPTSGGELEGRIVDNAGAVGAAFQINPTTAAAESMPEIAALPSGGFMVTWRLDTPEVNYFQKGDVYAQLFDAAGGKIGNSFLINSPTASGQTEPQIAVFGTDDFAIVYQDFSDSGQPALRMRLLVNDSIDFSGEPGPVAVNLSSNPVHPDAHPFYTRALNPNEALDSYGNYRILSGVVDVIGTAAADAVWGSDGANRIETGAGDDEVHAMDGNDRVIAGPGIDVVFGGAGDDTIDGGDGGDSLFGEGGNDTIDGGAGDDVIDGGSGADVLRGGSGNDVYIADSSDTVVEAEDGGIDEVRTGSSFFVLSAHVEKLTGTSDSRQMLIGNGLGNAISGGSGNDSLYGGGGNDVIDGGAGHDFIDGGVGADEMRGGLGSDIYAVDDAGDQVIELAGEGTDEIQTGLASYSLAGLPHVENLTGTSHSPQLLSGNDGDNVIRGGFGDDELIGGFGDDILIGFFGSDLLRGGAGNDVYVIDAGDTIVEYAGDGIDEVRTPGAIYVLGEALENLRATSDIGHDFRGNAGYNVIVGAAGNDLFRLQDGGGDWAFGLGGIDSFYFGAAFDGGDFVDGGDNRDSLLLQGDYVLTFVYAPTGGSSIVGIEGISLLSGANAAYGDTAGNLYSYDLTLVDANVAAGALMKINGFTLGAGENFTLDASAETDASLQILAGLGRDVLKGGQMGDAFVFGHDGRFAPGDRIDGQGGYDVLYLRGDYAIDFNDPGHAGALVNVESIALLTSANTEFAGGGDGEFDYAIVWADAMLAAGATMTVNGSRLQAQESFVFDGRAESDGNLRVFGGAAADTLRTGAGNDQLYGGGGADILEGGAGADLYRYLAPGDSAAAAPDTILGFVSGQDRIDLQRIDANSATPGEDDAFAWIGANAFSNKAGELRAALVSGDLWRVEGDLDGDGAADIAILVHLAGQPLNAGDFAL